MVTHFQLKHHVYAFNDSNTSIHDSFKSTRNSIQLAEKKGKKKTHWTQYHEMQTEDNKIKSISQLWQKNHVYAGSNI